MSYHVCPRDCFDSCGMLLEHGKLVGDPMHPFTSGFVCGKAALSLRQVSNKDRIVHPLVRTQHGFERISMDEALNLAAEELIKHQNHVFRLDYSGHMGLLSRFFHERLFRKLGSPEVVWDICSVAGDNQLLEAIGSIWGSDIDAIKGSDFVIIWGANVHNSSIHAYQWAKQIENVYVIDPVKTETAATFIHIAVNPAGDVALCLQILFVLSQMGFDVPLSFEDMPDLEKISGVSSEVVKMITRNLVASKNPFIFIGYGFQRQWNGGMAVRLIASILAVISKADRFYFDRPYQGVDIDYIRLGGQKPNETSISWTCLSEELLHVHDSVFFVLNANPLNTLPGRKKLIETFEKEDNFVIVHDMFLTETAQTADLIIPAKHYLEFEDVIASFGHPYLGFNEKGLDAPVDAMSNMELARELGRRIGLKDAELYETDRDLINGALRKLNIDYDYIKNVKLVRLPDPQKPTDITWPKMEDVLGTLNRPWEGKYMLLTPVARLRLHSQYDNELFTKPVVEVNVEDAMALGLKDGQSLTLYNDKGNMPVSCHVTDRVPKGVLKMEHGFWEGVERPNVNDLVEPRLQKLGSGSQIMWTFVDISTS